MLRHSNIHANPVIVETVERLFDEDRKFDRTERRLTFRESFSRPVTIRMREGEVVFHGFSKNISFEGIGIVSQTEFPTGAEAKIEIVSSAEKSPIILSRLAWCKLFGQGWYVSGWHFITAVRN